MELYRDLLVKLLENEEIRIEFPNLSISLSELVEMRCYNALKEIKAIIEDDRYSDKECFMKIEKSDLGILQSALHRETVSQEQFVETFEERNFKTCSSD